MNDSDARALNRVVRAMHDGVCPNCQKVFPASKMHVKDPGDWPGGHTTGGNFVPDPKWTGLRCPNCAFEISDKEVLAAMNEFSSSMLKDLQIFVEWRERSEK